MAFPAQPVTVVDAEKQQSENQLKTQVAQQLTQATGQVHHAENVTPANEHPLQAQVQTDLKQAGIKEHELPPVFSNADFQELINEGLEPLKGKTKQRFTSSKNLLSLLKDKLQKKFPRYHPVLAGDKEK